MAETSSVDAGYVPEGGGGNDPEARRQFQQKYKEKLGDGGFGDFAQQNALDQIRRNSRASTQHHQGGGMLGQLFQQVADGTLFDFTANKVRGSMFQVGEWFKSMAADLPGELRLEHG